MSPAKVIRFAQCGEAFCQGIQQAQDFTKTGGVGAGDTERVAEDRHHSQPALLVPVVETASKDIGEGEGRLRELRVTVLGEREADDHFRSNYSVAGAEGEDAGIFPEVIQATRHVLSESHPELQQRYFTLQFEYALPLGMHIGRSSELACSLLAYSAILDAVNSRERFIPKQGVAVTGRLEEASRVAPVSTEGIPAKTRAAFFSWADTLVVPEQQKPRFLEQLAILQEQYPSRKLTLIGLEEPKAFFYDRRISNHRLDSKTKHLAKKAWKQKFSVAGIATILVLLAVIGRLWYGPVDRNPQQAVFEGEFMTIQNAQNNPIKRFKVGEYTSTLVNSSGPGAVKNMAAFVDVTGDGLNEVIWGAFENGKEQTMQLNLYDLAGDSLIWSRPLSFDLFFPQNSDVIENRYSVREIEMLEQPDGSIDFILLLRHMPFFPSLIVHLDAGTGSIINEYVHIGHLIDVELHDIDNDQEQEIISVGLNNAYDLACMTVLEVDSLKGHSPLKGTYTIGNYSRADEISYVLFPRSVVSMALSKRINNNTATAINVNTEDKNIEVQVYEVFLNDASPYEARQGRLMYFFDYKMNLKSIGSTTQYDLWAKNLYRDGRIPKVDYEYLEAFKDSLVYLVRK